MNVNEAWVDEIILKIRRKMDWVSENGIFPVDFRQPDAPFREDSCGACVIAGGLLEIAKCVPESEQKMYRDAAVKIIRAIADTRADWGEGCDAIV